MNTYSTSLIKIMRFSLKLFIFLGSELQQILNDSSAEVDSSSSDFWVLVAALKVGAPGIASLTCIR